MNNKIKYSTIYKKNYFIKDYDHLLWIFSGSGKIGIGEWEYQFEDEGLILIPANTIYYIESIQLHVLIMELELKTSFKAVIYNIDERLKLYLANDVFAAKGDLTKADSDGDQNMFEQVLKTLEYDSISRVHTKNDDRIIKCAYYIEDNFQERISVHKLAKEQFLNPSYLSNLFKQVTGITISRYIGIKRLEQTIDDITCSTNTLQYIIAKNGYADNRAFNNAIKSEFACNPRTLRKRYNNMKLNELMISKSSQMISKYMANPIKNDLYIKEEYIDFEAKAVSELINNINCFAIGKASDLLRNDIQEQIKIAKKSINFKYCTFHNIFGDDMNVIVTKNENEHRIVLTNVLKICDFLNNNNIIPLIELGYFPSQIASGRNGPFTGYQLNTGGRINFKLWNQLVETFFQVVNSRYDNVKLWRFNFFSAIDFNSFWPNSYDDLIILYKNTYSIAKSINSNLLIGGFGFANLSNKDDKLVALLDKIYNDKLKIDFLSLHSYPFALENEEDYNEWEKIVDVKMIYDPNKLAADISKANRLCARYQIAEAYISEWNSLLARDEVLNDELYKAASIVYEFIKINLTKSRCESISYWVLSDIINEHGLEQAEFHGGIGLITNNGVCKPAFYAFELINKLKGEIISIDNNLLITKDKDKIKILAHNCSQIVAVNKGSTNVVKAINDNPQVLEFTIYIKRLEGKYKLVKNVINNTTSAKNWCQDLDNEEYISLEEIEYLKTKAKINVEKKIVNCNSSMKLTFNLKENEVVLYEITKKVTNC